jgi:hypothetical protein
MQNSSLTIASLVSVNSGSDSYDNKDVGIKKVAKNVHTRVQNGLIIIGPEDDLKPSCVTFFRISGLYWYETFKADVTPEDQAQ